MGKASTMSMAKHQNYLDPALHVVTSLLNVCVLKEHRCMGDLRTPDQTLTSEDTRPSCSGPASVPHLL